MSFVTSPIDIDVPTNGLLAAKTDFFFVRLNNKKDVCKQWTSLMVKVKLFKSYKL